MFALFPPSSSVTRFTVGAASWPIRLPASVEPVNATRSINAFDTSSSPTSTPPPGRTLKTPGGMSLSDTATAVSIALHGVCGDGLSTTVFPIASAGKIFHAASTNGALNGTIAERTPYGSRTNTCCAGRGNSLYGSASVSGISAAILIRSRACWMPAATITVAFRIVIPESRDSRSAISACRSQRRSQSASNASRLDSGERSLHSPSSNARRAASIALRASRLDALGTRATISPVEGSIESTVSPEEEPTNLPSMKSPYSRIPDSRVSWILRDGPHRGPVCSWRNGEPPVVLPVVVTVNTAEAVVYGPVPIVLQSPWYLGNLSECTTVLSETNTSKQ